MHLQGADQIGARLARIDHGLRFIQFGERPGRSVPLHFLDRARQLMGRQLISQSEFDAAQSRYDRVVASIHSREAGLQAAEVQLENTRIRAPFDGTIGLRFVSEGSYVSPATVMSPRRACTVLPGGR